MEFLKAVEFFDLSQDLFCVLGIDGYLKKVNDSFQKAVGYSREELHASPLTHFLHPDDSENFVSFYAGGAGADILVNRFKCSTGCYKWFAWNGTKVPDERFIYASVRDVSAQKQMEEHLNMALQTNQRILDSSIDLICTIDTQGKFVTVSKVSESLLGYTSQEMEGRSCEDFIHPADLEITSKMALS